jgi:hypothetical protein
MKRLKFSRYMTGVSIGILAEFLYRNPDYELWYFPTFCIGCLITIVIVDLTMKDN